MNYVTIPFMLILSVAVYPFVKEKPAEVHVDTALVTIAEQMNQLGDNLSGKTERGVYDTLFSYSGFIYQYTYFRHEETQLLCCRNITSYDDPAEFTSVQIMYNSVTEQVSISGAEPVLDGDGAPGPMGEAKTKSCALEAVGVLVCATAECAK